MALAYSRCVALPLRTQGKKQTTSRPNGNRVAAAVGRREGRKEAEGQEGERGRRRGREREEHDDGVAAKQEENRESRLHRIHGEAEALEDWIARGDRLKQDGCCCGDRETRPREREFVGWRIGEGEGTWFD